MTFSELVRLLCRLLPCIPQSLRGSQLLHFTNSLPTLPYSNSSSLRTPSRLRRTPTPPLFIEEGDRLRWRSSQKRENPGDRLRWRRSQKRENPGDRLRWRRSQKRENPGDRLRWRRSQKRENPGDRLRWRRSQKRESPWDRPYGGGICCSRELMSCLSVVKDLQR